MALSGVASFHQLVESVAMIHAIHMIFYLEENEISDERNLRI